METISFDMEAHKRRFSSMSWSLDMLWMLLKLVFSFLVGYVVDVVKVGF
jgi:hypothetical protein